MDFRPLSVAERSQLISALRGNAEGTHDLLMNPAHTGFDRAIPIEESDLDRDVVIDAIRSVPTHY